VNNGGPYHILPSSSGGYLGLNSAAVLAALEEQAGEPIGRRFDLVAGTSVSGIIAAAVAFELPLSRLGDATFAQVQHPLLLPAVNVTRSLTKVFKTPHAEGSRGDECVRVADAVLAACAAPAYFPSVEIGGALYADGGLFAVAPDQVALHEAEHFIGIEVARVHMLSVGMATVGYQPAA
jgi:uncharacterized protein